MLTIVRPPTLRCDATPTESSGSDSDYADTLEKKLAMCAQRRRQGKNVSDTAEEDEEAEEDMVADVVSDT
jgi:hypothetical protein